MRISWRFARDGALKLGPRRELSAILILGAAVLVVAIFVGQNMGNRVLGAIASRPATLFATPIAAPSASPDDRSGPANAPLWKRREVISVATDPAFPDPRVTPEPSPPPTPSPKPRPSPSPSSDSDAAPAGEGQDQSPTLYTSPPLPLPLASHDPDETSPPEENGGPGASPGAVLRAAPSGVPRPAATGRGSATVPPYSTGTPLP
jgi:hypothetical protein